MFRNVNNSTHSLTPDFLATNFCSLYSDAAYTRAMTRPSASSSLCPRQIALGINVPPRAVKQPKALSDYASIGNTIEEGVLAKYRKHNQLYLSQFKLPTELTSLGLDIGGIIDAFLIINHSLILVDIKTVGNVDSHPSVPLQADELALLTQGKDIVITSADGRVKHSIEKGVKEAHIAQLQTYAAVTGFDDVYIQLMSRRVQDGYTTDGNPSVKFEQINTSLAALEKRVGIIMYSQLCLKEGFVPDKLSGIKKTTCRDAFCTFVDYCWEGNSDLSTSLQVISPNISTELKLIALERAKEYMAAKDERKAITLRIIEAERDRRIKKGLDV